MHTTRRGFLCALGLVAPALMACRRSPRSSSGMDGGTLQRSFFCFDTACSLGGTVEQELLDALVERCQGFERALSRTIATSDVGRINAAAGAPVQVQPKTAELIARALDYARASDGLFDITIGAVTQLWDFRNEVVPTHDQVAAALAHVGYERVHVEGTTVTLGDPEARLDLGGIAKGYVADVLCDELEAQGITSAYVNLGGNVKVVGTKPDGSDWRVGVRDPSPGAESGASVARIALTGGSVVTSGLYERQFEKDGRSYWHILDPRTGYPVTSDLVSATIVSERSIDGDGYTKPLFMWGMERALSWAREHKDLDVLLIDQAGNRRMCPEGAFELL